MTSPAFAIAEQSKELKAGRVSCTELLMRSLQAIDRDNDRLNGFCLVDHETALAAARLLDQEAVDGQWRGPLHGIPIAIKDNIDVQGLPTQCAAAPLAGWVAEKDAPCVTSLREAGAVIVGKTNMHELAYGGTGNVSCYGPARNPIDDRRIAGGSSSGSATVVAASMVPVALGSDTGGSVRIPASLCGLVGYKPSLDLIPTSGVRPLSWTLDHVGTLARSVSDAGLVAALMMADSHIKRSLLSVVGQQIDGGFLEGKRLGFCHVEHMGVDRPVQEQIERMRGLVATLGVKADDVGLQYAQESHVSWLNIMYAEASSFYVGHPAVNYREFSPEVKVQLEAGRFVSGPAYLRAQRFRSFYSAYFDTLFERFDVLCLPSLPVTAPLIGQKEVVVNGKVISTQDAMTFTNLIGNMLGCPVLTLPIGRSADGLPVGLSLLCKRGNDAAVLKYAQALESVVGGGRLGLRVQQY